MKNLTFLTWMGLLGMLILNSGGCSSDDTAPVIDCTQSGLAVSLSSKSNPTSCTSPDGSISVTGSGGTAPYQFKLDNGPFQSNSTFSGLTAGSFQISAKDANGCESSISVGLDSPGNLVVSSVQVVNTTCGGSSGSITITAIGTTALTYQLNGGAFQSSNSFSNLQPGNYSVVVRDANSCTTSSPARVLSGVSYTSAVRPVLQTSCGLTNSGCHSSSTGRDLNSYNSVRLRASQIKTRISLPPGNPSLMPQGGPNLPQTEIDLITCWVDDGAPNN
ncbi:MAG: SprB repeat-containing protein [Cyclobacteriaceae bacterium]|jgi:hypothetical protein